MENFTQKTMEDFPKRKIKPEILSNTKYHAIGFGQKDRNFKLLHNSVVK